MLLFMTILLLASGAAPSPSPGPSGGRVFVICQPGLAVRLDDRKPVTSSTEAGGAAIEDVPAGEHRLHVEARDGSFRDVTVLVQPGKTAQVSLLVLQRRPKPAGESWNPYTGPSATSPGSSSQSPAPRTGKPTFEGVRVITQEVTAEGTTIRGEAATLVAIADYIQGLKSGARSPEMKSMTKDGETYVFVAFVPAR